tara:strand:+ start:1193 stop:2209 length:1017 start_codon:yes stop_codon:yes gene_type:complete
METQKMKISVVILNWNGKIWLEKFLDNVIENSKIADIVVVDNNSTDNSITYLTKNYPAIRIIKNKRNYGYAKGYNEALKQIDSEYFILLNSDIEVTKNWISPVIDLMEKDKKISACQPKILDYNNKKKFEYAGACGGFIDKLGYPFCRGRIFNHLEKDSGQYNDSIEIFWATGACIFLRSSHFFEIGGLDEDFFAHQEEIDLCWRFKNKGYKIFVETKSVVYHVGGGTLNVGSPLKTYLNFRNSLYMLFKNLPIIHLFTVIPIRLILDGVAALSFLKMRNGPSHLFAVVRAHFMFYTQIPKLIIKRIKNFKENNYNFGKKTAIIISFYLRKIRKFSEL